jgi:hypothetical protein
MSYIIIHDPHTRILTLKFTGSISLQELQKALREVMLAATHTGVSRFLVDFSDAVLDLAVDESSLLPQVLMQLSIPTVWDGPSIRRAIVTAQTNGASALFDDSSPFGDGHAVKLFHNLEEAKGWLQPS